MIINYNYVMLMYNVIINHRHNEEIIGVGHNNICTSQADKQGGYLQLTTKLNNACNLFSLRLLYKLIFLLLLLCRAVTPKAIGI